MANPCRRKPVGRALAEATRLVKLVVSGAARAQGRFEGDFWRLDLSRLAHKAPLRPDLPVWVAALRTPLVRVAGEVADGLIGHPSWSLAWAQKQMRASERWQAPYYWSGYIVEGDWR